MTFEYEPAGEATYGSQMPMDSQPARVRTSRVEPAEHPVQPTPTVLPVTVPHRAMGAWESQEVHLLGINTVAMATGTVVGMRFGGLYGAVAGTLFGGAFTNLLRAATMSVRPTQDSSKEAVLSATYGIVSAGLGGYLLYVGSKKKKESPRG